MKRLFFAIAVFFTVFSCKSKTELLTEKQWNIYMSSNYLDDKDQIRIHKENESAGFFFSKDGKVEISEYDKKTVSGTWEWQDDKKIKITWLEIRQDVFNIVKLEKSELMLSKINQENQKLMMLSFKTNQKGN